MKKAASPHRRRSAKAAALGRNGFAKFRAVEGVERTESVPTCAAKFDRKGLSSEERIRTIVAAQRKGQARAA